MLVSYNVRCDITMVLFTLDKHTWAQSGCEISYSRTLVALLASESKSDKIVIPRSGVHTILHFPSHFLCFSGCSPSGEQEAKSKLDCQGLCCLRSIYDYR